MEKYPKQWHKYEPKQQVIVVIDRDFVTVFTGFDEVFAEEEQAQPTDCS